MLKKINYSNDEIFVTAKITQNTKKLKNIKDKLINSKNANFNDYIRLYRWALKSGDSVTSCMLLYNLLSLIITNKEGNNDRLQEKINNFIRKIEPNVKDYITIKPNKNHLETIYTYYRNQIARTYK